MHITRAIGLRLVAGLLLAWTTVAAQDVSRSSWSGVYTAEQAAAGEKVYFDRCAMCHGADLGGVERAPALAGPQFLDAWHGKDLRRLLERIEAMPPDAPVSGTDAVAALAYLLSAAEMPAGQTPLPVDRAGLAAIRFERESPK